MTGIRRFLQVFSNRRGVIGIMFGLIWAPLIGWSFMAVTLSMKTLDQFVADSAMDAAMIAASATPVSDLSSGTSGIATDRATILNAYWVANGGPGACGPGTSSITNSLAESTSGTLSASIQCNSTAGGKSNSFVASSQVTLQGYNVEVAMVLDNTGSMTWGVDSNDNKVLPPTTQYPSKISSEKQAALSFLTILQASASGAGVVRVGMIPMTVDINIVNPGDPNESSVTIGNTLAQQAAYVNFSPKIMIQPSSTGTHCSLGSWAMNVPQSVPTPLSYWSGASQGTACGSSYYYYTMPTSFPGTSDANWLGCVSDRDQLNLPSTSDTIDYTATNAAPTTTLTNSLFPADNINCGGYLRGPLSIVPLQDIFTAANLELLTDRLLCRPDKFPMLANSYQNSANDASCATATNPSLTTINGVSYNTTTVNGVLSNTTGMLANGDTDLPLGLAWGYYMLTPGFPMFPVANQSSSNTTGVKKFVVFFTDGVNTQDRFDAPNYSAAPGNMNNEAKAVCANIKTAGITIFTIGTSDADTSLLTSCASTGDSYTGLNSKQIKSVFEDIAGQISNLRISQ